MQQLIKHSESCNITQDWSGAKNALSMCPERDLEKAYNDLQKQMNTCTCVVGKEISKLLFDFFIWFRFNGELYVDKSIEEMIEVYQHQKNFTNK